MYRTTLPQPVRLSSALPPKKKNGPLFKSLLVVIAAVLLTTAAVRASDSVMLAHSGLVAGVGESGMSAHCPKDMAYVPTAQGGFCIDRFEASPGDACGTVNPKNQFETIANMGKPSCVPTSLQNRDPWVYVTLSQAIELCARVGKRLPSNNEWYRAALGTPDTVEGQELPCVLGKTGAGNAEKTGTHDSCVSSYGAYDMVGNVWEWVDTNIIDGTYMGRMLPDEGYVTEADVDGVPVAVAATSSAAFHDDYFSVNREGVRGMFRGGFWSMTEKAGVFAINATIPTSFVGVAVGFRCVQ